MTLDITNAVDLSTSTATYLIYGQQGVGKTSSLKYLPGKTLVIDIDKSSRVLKGNDNIDIVNVDTSNIWEEWNEIVVELIKNEDYEKNYDNIVIDNISELFRGSLENLGKLGRNQGVPSMADYQKVDFLIMRAIRALKKLDVRLIFTAWEKTDQFESENGQTFTRAFPDLRNAISNNFLGLCDVVARLVVIQTEEGETKRGFVLSVTNDVMAKNRLDDRKGAKVEELIASD